MLVLVLRNSVPAYRWTPRALNEYVRSIRWWSVGYSWNIDRCNSAHGLRCVPSVPPENWSYKDERLMLCQVPCSSGESSAPDYPPSNNDLLDDGGPKEGFVDGHIEMWDNLFIVSSASLRSFSVVIGQSSMTCFRNFSFLFPITLASSFQGTPLARKIGFIVIALET